MYFKYLLKCILRKLDVLSGLPLHDNNQSEISIILTQSLSNLLNGFQCIDHSPPLGLNFITVRARSLVLVVVFFRILMSQFSFRL